MRNFINNYLKKLYNSKKVQLIIHDIKIKLKPLYNRWLQFSTKEKQFLIALGAIFAIFIIFSFINMLISFTQNLNTKSQMLQNYLIDTKYINKLYKELNQTTANEFSEISLARIQGDVKQSLNIQTPNVVLQDNQLIITQDNIAFELVIPLIEQLRKSYGIFPENLKITKAKSGYVNFKVVFMVEK